MSSSSPVPHADPSKARMPVMWAGVMIVALSPRKMSRAARAVAVLVPMVTYKRILGLDNVCENDVY